MRGKFDEFSVLIAAQTQDAYRLVGNLTRCCGASTRQRSTILYVLVDGVATHLLGRERQREKMSDVQKTVYAIVSKS